jgi:hypothetical protein
MTAFNLAVRVAACPFLACAMLATPAASVAAQAGDTSFVTYPNWKRADRVSPAVAAQVTYDPATRKWVYTYQVANASGAQQDLNEFRLIATGVASTFTAPAGWQTLTFTDSAAIPGATMFAYGDSYVTGATGRVATPSPAQLAPGAAVTAVARSDDPPGEARFYARGYAGVPLLPDTVDDEFLTPDDSTDAQRGWTLGPTRYTTVRTFGTQETTDLVRTDRFLGFMNVDTAGTTFRNGTAVIVIKFDQGTDGDLVCPETFRAFLNDVDVTTQFFPGTNPVATGSVSTSTTCRAGPLRAAVFTVGPNSPLVMGANVLRTTVAGLPSTFGLFAVPSLVDTDIIRFSVQP